MDWTLTYIIGGGVSARNFSIDWMHNGTILGVNEATFYLPYADAFITGDHTWAITAGDRIAAMPERVERHFCFRARHTTMRAFERHRGRMWTRDFTKAPATQPWHLSSGAHPKAGCTGIAAINLAYQQGCRLAVLVGFDFDPNDYRYWYDDTVYPRVFVPEVLAAFQAVADWYKTSPMRVINANPGSHVPGFEKATPSEARRIAEDFHVGTGRI